MQMHEPALEEFPARTQDKLRYGDTDRQGHINNAVFATFFETGRVEVLYNEQRPVLDVGYSFVIVNLAIHFVRELHWPGMVDIGTRVAGIGRSSVTLSQALYEDGVCVATADSVIVQMDEATRRSAPLTAGAREKLAAFS
jgi:acyl-CoA thioester hydrolase